MWCWAGRVSHACAQWEGRRRPITAPVAWQVARPRVFLNTNIFITFFKTFMIITEKIISYRSYLSILLPTYYNIIENIFQRNEVVKYMNNLLRTLFPGFYYV